MSIVRNLKMLTSNKILVVVLTLAIDKLICGNDSPINFVKTFIIMKQKDNKIGHFTN